jgi:TnpA family transposase
MEHGSRIVADFPKLSKFLKWYPTRDKQLTHDELDKIAYNILPEEQFPKLAEFLDGKSFDKKAAQWKFYSKQSRKFSLYLRPILLAIPFEYYKDDSHIMELINLLKTHYSSKKSPSKLELSNDIIKIPKNMVQYLKRKPNDDLIDPYLFEFFVYQKIYHQIDRGKLCCNDSVSYCDIDHDLIDDSLVDNAEKISAEFGYPKIPIYCDKRLDDALKELDGVWDKTTENIRLKNNSGFNIKETKDGKKKWNLLYDSKEKLDDSFFKTLPKIEIADVVMFIGDLVGMWDGFTHIKDRYIKRRKPAVLAVNACLLSDAFGFGTIKMADMSDIKFSLLRSTHEDFIRIDTLCAANDIVSNHIHSLAIFKLWNLIEDKLLADADGQKFSTSDSTIQSRYSKKYLGKGRGISLYTLIANFVAVNAKNIGLNEYEGHSLYDMIYGNKTDIDINMVTGDNHSLNKLNFVILDSIDVAYVPSIKNVREAADDLYSVKSSDNYKELIQPKGQINVDRIRSQKRSVLRVLLSLIMQENTQSNIIRKLNSHTRYARLKSALFEYNKIFKSIHVLNLIDDMELRKAIRTARNRTEAYHQLQGIIRKIYTGVFKGKKIVDNRVSAHAVRLIANCIIAYNSIILNTVYEKMVKEGVEREVIEEFSRISPIAWAHMLFTGRYSFKKKKGYIDIEEMAEMLEQIIRQSILKQ